MCVLKVYEGPPVVGHVLCAICNRTFGHESDKKRYKCVEEREGSQSVNNVKQCSVSDVISSSGARED